MHRFWQYGEISPKEESGNECGRRGPQKSMSHPQRRLKNRGTIAKKLQLYEQYPDPVPQIQSTSQS